MIINSLAPFKDAQCVACVSHDRYRSDVSTGYKLGKALSVNGNSRVVSIDLSDIIIHKLEKKMGCFDFLGSDTVPLDEIIINVENNFDMIQAGMSRDITLIHSEKTEGLISKLKQTYEYIIFELPPANYFPSMYKAISLFDGIIMLLECEISRWESSQRFKEILVDAGANILGAIMINRKFYIPEWLYGKL